MNEERNSIAPKGPWLHGSEEENRVLNAKIESIPEQLNLAEKEEIAFTMTDPCGGDDTFDVCDNPGYLDPGDYGYVGGCAFGGCGTGSCSCGSCSSCSSCSSCATDDGGS